MQYDNLHGCKKWYFHELHDKCLIIFLLISPFSFVSLLDDKSPVVSGDETS